MKIPKKAPCPHCGAANRLPAGADLRVARRRAGLTLRSLGAMFYPALSASYLSEIETGRKAATEEIVTRYEALARKEGRP